MSLNLNGDMAVWTMGDGAKAALASGAMHPDCFRLHKAGVAVHTSRRSGDVPHWSRCGRVIPASWELEVTTIDSAMGATDVTAMVYRGEGSEVAELVGRAIPVSFWLKSTVAGTFAFHLSNGAENRSYTMRIQVDEPNYWTLFSGMAYLDTEAVDADWWTDHRVGYTAALVLAAGANFQGEFDKWHSHAASALILGGAAQSNFNATLGNKVNLTGLRIGGGAMFQPPELVEQACMRYMAKSFGRWTDPASNLGLNTGELTFGAPSAGPASAISPLQRFAVPMRKAPAMTGYNPGASGSQARTASFGDCTATTFDNKTEYGFRYTCTTPAGTTIGNPIGLHWVADASLPALGTDIGG